VLLQGTGLVFLVLTWRLRRPVGDDELDDDELDDDQLQGSSSIPA
jgi:hypothetical protein